MNKYAAAVAVDAFVSRALVSHPRSNLISVWDLDVGRYIRRLAYQKPSGIALDLQSRTALVTSLTGQFSVLNLADLSIRATGEVAGRFDNHAMWLAT